jgi:recyclin-1
MLNPQKWAGNQSGPTAEKGTRGHMVNGEVVFDQSVERPDDEDEGTEKTATPPAEEKDEVDALGDSVNHLGMNNNNHLSIPPTPNTPASLDVPQPSPTTMVAFDRLQLLVSLDTALELIHGDRESLKRTETFAKYPGRSGTKVVETIEEIFILLLKAISDRHIAPGFRV